MSIQQTVAHRTLKGSMLLAVVLCVLPAASSRLEGQDRRKTGAVTVALVASLPPGGLGAVIQRRPGAGSRDVILLDGSSSIADLASALRILRSSPRELNRSVTVSITRTEGTRIKNATVRRRLQQQLNALHAAVPRGVDGVGMVRAINIRVEPTTEPLRPGK